MNSETGSYYEGAAVKKAKERGEQLIELPCKPTPDCSCCRGKGAKKSWGTSYAYGACPVCYPDHPQKAQTFNRYLATIGKQKNLDGMLA